MTITIDRAGRIVIPKSMRQAAGLVDEVDVRLVDGAVTLTAPARTPVRNAQGKLRLPTVGQPLDVDTVREARFHAQR